MRQRNASLGWTDRSEVGLLKKLIEERERSVATHNPIGAGGDKPGMRRDRVCRGLTQGLIKGVSGQKRTLPFGVERARHVTAKLRGVRAGENAAAVGQLAAGL